MALTNAEKQARWRERHLTGQRLLSRSSMRRSLRRLPILWCDSCRLASSSPLPGYCAKRTDAIESAGGPSGKRPIQIKGPHVVDFAEGIADPLCTECPPAGAGTLGGARDQAALRALSHASR